LFGFPERLGWRGVFHAYKAGLGNDTVFEKYDFTAELLSSEIVLLYGAIAWCVCGSLLAQNTRESA